MFTETFDELIQPNYRPYLSLDTETTGLNEDRIQILQIGAVLDFSPLVPVDELPKFDVVIEYSHFEYSEPFAMQMNAGLLKRIAAKDHTTPLKYALTDLLYFIEQSRGLIRSYNKKYGDDNLDKVQIAGKNIAWDLYTIKRNLKEYNLINQWNKSVQHRNIDVGSMYWPRFGYTPSLGDINKITGRDEVSHDAISDAHDVIEAIRYIRANHIKGE